MHVLSWMHKTDCMGRNNIYSQDSNRKPDIWNDVIQDHDHKTFSPLFVALIRFLIADKTRLRCQTER